MSRHHSRASSTFSSRSSRLSDVKTVPEVKEEADKLITIVTPDAPEQATNLTDEDLQTLTKYVKKMTTLYDLLEEDWNDDCYEVINEFFINARHTLLAVYFDDDILTCSLAFPSFQVADITYFIRDPMDVLTPENFHDNVTFGTFGEHMDRSILMVIEHVFAPIFFNIKTWPDSIKNDFSANMHTFLSNMTDRLYKKMGMTVIYIPSEGMDLPVQVAAKDKELVKRLEAVVVHWTRQIRMCLGDQEQSAQELNSPVDEYDFWVSRYENLLGVEHQLKNPSLKQVCDILTYAQSANLKHFVTQSEEIERHLTEAKSNIEFLQVIKDPCNILAAEPDPKNFPSHIPYILNLFRVIWNKSPYYNTTEKITSLCRALSTQIMLKCINYIDLDSVFLGQTRSGMAMLSSSIESCLKYKKIYRTMAEAHKNIGITPWVLDNGLIFNHLDSFVQRCRDMIEICEGMIEFGRIDETENLPKPLFGGTKGPEFELMCEKIERMFAESLKCIEEVEHTILDVKSVAWYDEILRFRFKMKEIEIVIENLVTAVFNAVTNVEEGIEALAALYNYSRRRTLKQLFDRKTTQVFNMFKEEIQDVKKDLVTEKETYHANLPYFAGRALMAHLKKDRLVRLKKVIDDAAWMSYCSVTEEVFHQYEKLVTSIEELILNLFRKWVDSIGEDVTGRLNRTLMCHSASRPGFLECNIDRSVLSICHECKYWEILKYEIPVYVQPVYSRYANIKFVYESVLSVVMNHNKIISALSDEERILFKQLTNVVEKKIIPGVLKLTWTTDVSDEYIAECSAYTSELQEFLDDYKTCNLQIVSICEKICDSPLVLIAPNYAFELDELKGQLEGHRAQVTAKLIDYFKEIINYLIVVYEGFEPHIANMNAAWEKYVRNFDQLMEEAIRICVKNSMTAMYEALHGDETTGPNPLLKLQVNMKDDKINFDPPISAMSDLVTTLLPEIIYALATIPRLLDKFRVISEIPQPFADVIETDLDCRNLQSMLNNEVSHTIQKIKEYMKVWEPFRDLWEIDKEKFIQKYKQQNPTASAFDANIGRYTEVANNVQILDSVNAVYFLVVNATGLKAAIIEHCELWQKKLCELLHELATEKINYILNYIDINSERAMKIPQDLEELKAAVAYFEQLRDEVDKIEEEFPLIDDQFVVLDKYKVEITPEMRAKKIDIPKRWYAYLELLEQADKMLNYHKETFKANLLDKIEVLKSEATNLLEEFVAKGPFSSDWKPKDALNYIAEMRKKLQELKDKEAQLRKDLGVFNISLADNPELLRLEAELDALEIVWTLAGEWDQAWEEYKKSFFWDVVLDAMEVNATNMYKKLSRLAKELQDKNWQILNQTMQLVDDFRRTLPLITALKNPAMRERHWKRVKQAINYEFDHFDESFTLEAIISKMKMIIYEAEIRDISESATMELQIEKSLRIIKETWKTMGIEMDPTPELGVHKIKKVDECMATLEDHMIQLANMKATKYVEPFINEVNLWEKTLNYMIETVELALWVQKNWYNVGNCLHGEDIRKQLPKETTAYDAVTGSWAEITSILNEEKVVFNAIQFRPAPYLFDQLTILNASLEGLQRSFDKYLETKRRVFPRFYFISNNDLIEILATSKKPEKIQPHYRKMFDSIYKVKLAKNIMTSKTEAEGMFSELGEYIEFSRPVTTEGQVEHWLKKLEMGMFATLKDQLKACRLSLRKMIHKKDKWLVEWPGQLCEASSRIFWTTEVTTTLAQCKVHETKSPLKKLKKKQNIMLSRYAEMSRRELNKITRIKVTSLIVIGIHGRDVIEKLYKANCLDLNSFEWYSQMRFYWDKEQDEFIIKQTTMSFQYVYEYLGNSKRIVVTPMTERCMITMTTALCLFCGCATKGPAGTGKTETIKELGNYLGVWVIVINCSDGLDYKSMGRQFSGLAQTGCWGCFHDFNRINIEVLSVVAQQILSILKALSYKAETFVFEGTEIRLTPSCGIFATMRPGLHTELPDNLKAMLRPVAMVQPDAQIIAEYLLYSDGFTTNKVLSKKVSILYQLAAQQLSKQSQYDFELRSLVNLLRYAGQIRRLKPDLNEDEVICTAMREVNMPKLTRVDLPLFNDLIEDIFTNVEVQVFEDDELRVAIEEDLKENGLQCLDVAVEKVIQLHKVKSSRHSTVLLGATCTAKTVTWRTLANALNNMKKQGKIGFQGVSIFLINPKAVLLKELFGEFNISTNEWTDGVLSSIMRKLCADETPTEKWIVFDGPVDSGWIDEMNSLMDDNKVLTLINSERISMPEQISLLFEIEDISSASPATVSRCGMMYHDYDSWGWWPYMNSWLEKHPCKDISAIIKQYVEQYLEMVLTFKKQNCKEAVPSVELNSVISLCRLCECFMKKENGLDPSNPEAFQVMSKLWFFYCLIWSVCITVDDDGRKRIDALLREKEGIFPLKETVYEFYVDVRTQMYIPWEEKLSSTWKYDQHIPFYKIVVPTIETIRYESVIKSLIDHNYPVLVSGPVGGGKTCILTSIINNINTTKYSLLAINMSAQTTSQNLQDSIEGRLEKVIKGVYVPFGGKKLVVYLEDLNMPSRDEWGCQPALELLRQWLDYHSWFDRVKKERKEVKDLLLVCAMGPPGGGRYTITDRLLSKFNMISINYPSHSQLMRIFGTMISQKIVHFEDEIKVLAHPLTEATIDLFQEVGAKMLPTPSKIHYLFNLRDISKVFQGMLRCDIDSHNNKHAFMRLWIHECFRVFHDRLVDEPDREWFGEQLNTTMGRYFNLVLHNVCPNRQSPTFTHFMNPKHAYQDCQNEPALRAFLEEKVIEHNHTPGLAALELVMFKDAISHVCRIVRVISQPRGNMVLIGIGGSGRQSLTRLAAFICEYTTYQVEVGAIYRLIEFREDLKTLYHMTGVEWRKTVFLLSDNQIMYEVFLEILNNMLSNGEVPNLYKNEEMMEIKEKLKYLTVKEGLNLTSEELYNYLIEKARANMHIVLCLSHLGDAFRDRLRQYPALVNNTTIDWFDDWPREALLEVAHTYFDKLNFVTDITGVLQTSNVVPVPVTDSKTRETIVGTPQERMQNAVSNICVEMHESIKVYSKRMFLEMKRRNYVTPTHFFEIVNQYKIMLPKKREETATQANKLRNGLSKIKETQEKVEVMTKELEEAQVKVAEFQRQCDEYLVIIVNQQREADEQQRIVTARSIKIAEEETICNKLAAVAQADLDEAMPALERAIKALDALSKKDISEMKSYVKPPPKVEMVLESVMILKQVEPSWTQAKKEMAELNFLNSLREFDKDHITDKTLKKIAVYTSNEEFEPEKVGIVSFAAKSLCMWVIAMEKYGRIYRVVAPKKMKLDEALASLKQKQALLAEAQAKLQELSEMIARLQKEYDEKLAIKEELNAKAELLKLKLERAAILVECLAGEKDRWKSTVTDLDMQFEWLPGDCLLATGFTTYMGPFISYYREPLIEEWKRTVADQKVPSCPNFSYISFMVDATTIMEWNIQGLPSDSFSTENAIIITNSVRWPLIIDPQMQAFHWIRDLEGWELRIIDTNMSDYVRTLEDCIMTATPLMLKNVLERMENMIMPIVNRALIEDGSRMLLKMGEKFIIFQPDFRFYITTKLANPNFAPELSAKTNIVNFAIKEQGLEEQLLAIVVRKERPQLEEQKLTLVKTIAKGKRTLRELEDELLSLLNETRGSLLDDEKLISTLQTSKTTSITVKHSVETSEATEVAIDTAREGYRPSAKRASILFFVLNDMSQIDPMYQFALDSYIHLFTLSIEKSQKSPHLAERIGFLNDFHTYAVYRTTCRGLFEKHKLIFSFHMCVKILDNMGKIMAAEYNFLLKGGIVLDREEQLDNPCPGWLSDQCWDNITELDKIAGFHGITNSFEQYTRDWHTWYIHSEPETLPLIGEWQDICSEFQRMLIVRSLRQDRITFCTNQFVVNTLGPKFVEPPALDIKTAFEESTPNIPFIFVLSPGADPGRALNELAEHMNMTQRFNMLSLGQGQAPIATRLLQNAIKDGTWVFLANCHLSLSWMPRLDKIVEALQHTKVHPKFRLWLSSAPHKNFPISILQTGIKMTTEPPKGIRTNLRRAYSLMTEERFNVCLAKEKYKKLLFALAFFHSVLLERKKFQQLGWNVDYSFNEADFQVSENLLSIYLDEYQNTPWDALKYLIASVNYGGHVTDEWDRRLLNTYINQFFCEDALNVQFYRLSTLPTYYIPKDGSLKSYLDYITVLPNSDRPEAFGQHPNADITYLMSETTLLFETLLSLQLQTSSFMAASTKEEKVISLVSDILSRLPNEINYDDTEKLIGQDKTPFDVILLQEITHYNALLMCIRQSLGQLQNSIQGLVVMSAESDEIFLRMYDGKVPEKWLKSYPSLKNLGSWTRDLILRVEHFSHWALTTHPPLVFWLSAYTFPTGLLTAVLQTESRHISLPIDALSWDFTVQTNEENTITERPDIGIYVKGLYLEAAGWDKKRSCLMEPAPMQLVCPMPVIQFKPVEQSKKSKKGLYTCPCYYYPIRSGSIQRSSYVVAVDLKNGTETSDFWVKRGTALLLSLAT